ncbi:MAG: glycoside hydrolase family 2 protein [Cytophagales bacterium]|nr:glycoside hydrolase family 2 protein [Cytophagales bacterium]
MNIHKIFGVILILLSFISCDIQEKHPLLTIDIGSGWQFSEESENVWLPATVPGCVHTDLLSNGKIPDPFYRFNEDSIKWIETKNWVYKTTFDINNEDLLIKKHIELVFKGLDTYAEILLNGTKIKETDNMFVEYVVDCKKYIKPKGNELKIIFKSPVNIGKQKLKNHPYLVPAINEYAPDSLKTSVHTRKAPYHYGWDWGPRLVTSGIWRPVVLQGWNIAKINDVHYILDEVDSNVARYRAEILIYSGKNTKANFEILVNDKPVREIEFHLKKGENEIKTYFSVRKPKLWWPNGLGEQPIYKFESSLIHYARKIDTDVKTMGIRNVALITEPEGDGNLFKFRVNGKDVFMKGANYIPPDNFNTRVSKARYDGVIKAAKDANMNMLRVWGGAIYEDDYFYDLCDKNGILIWQDFMFACAMVPRHKEHLENIKKEVEYNVLRLRHHPCLALWCGNNENMVMQGWSLGKKFNLSPEDSSDMMNTYEKLFHQTIPDIITKYNPTTAYWPTSPGGGTDIEDKQNVRSGDVHDWWGWFGKATAHDLISRRQRFISEYGLQSFPDIKTIQKISLPEDLFYDSKLFDYKQRSLMPWLGLDAKGNTMNGNDMIQEYIKMSYSPTPAFADMVYLSQLSHAYFLKDAIEGHRSHKPYCWGSLYWQIDDCWPTVSWSTVDYDYRWKAPHYFVKKAYENLLVYPHIIHDSLKIHVISDLPDDISGTLHFTLYDFDGNILKNNASHQRLEKNASKTIISMPLKDYLDNINNRNKIYLYTTFAHKDELLCDNILYFDLPKNLQLSKPVVDQIVSDTKFGYQLKIKSNTLVKNIQLDNKYSDGFFDDNYFDVLPGKVYSVNYYTTQKSDSAKVNFTGTGLERFIKTDIKPASAGASKKKVKK